MRAAADRRVAAAGHRWRVLRGNRKSDDRNAAGVRQDQPPVATQLAPQGPVPRLFDHVLQKRSSPDDLLRHGGHGQEERRGALLLPSPRSLRDRRLGFYNGLAGYMAPRIHEVTGTGALRARDVAIEQDENCYGGTGLFRIVPRACPRNHTELYSQWSQHDCNALRAEESDSVGSSRLAYVREERLRA